VTRDHLECVVVYRGDNGMDLEEIGYGCAQDSCRTL
jgi:hypothetical protein